jgi:serine/threonine protein kinase
VFDLVTEPGAPMYFVMELLEGQSIRAAGKARPLELSRVVRFMRQAAEALAAAHAVGVMHRDIKPDNLFLVPDAVKGEQLKVLDFGVARMAPLHGGGPVPRVTQTGQTVGTPLWMAPEQLVAGELDPRVDVYALATVAYVLLTRRFPFDGVAMNEVVLQRMTKPARPLPAASFLGERVPVELTALLARCLERDAKLRPQMAEVAQCLSVIEQSLMATTGEETDAALEPVSRRRWWPWAAALTAGVAASGLLARLCGWW